MFLSAKNILNFDIIDFIEKLINKILMNKYVSKIFYIFHCFLYFLSHFKIHPSIKMFL